MHRTTARLSAALVTAALVAVATPASAHVGVSSTDAARGGFGKVTFRVPNESDSAATTTLVVTLPRKTPLATVTAAAKPGWTVELGREKLDAPTKVGDVELSEVVRTITWTAQGGGIPVGQFDEFAISGGPFPEADDMTFAARQTYADGKVVDWDQAGHDEAGHDATEPERPAPVLTLAEAAEDHHGASGAEEAGAEQSASRQAADDSDDSDDIAAWLAGGALVVAAAALLVSLRQNRRRA